MVTRLTPKSHLGVRLGCKQAYPHNITKGQKPAYPNDVGNGWVDRLDRPWGRQQSCHLVHQQVGAVQIPLSHILQSQVIRHGDSEPAQSVQHEIG